MCRVARIIAACAALPLLAGAQSFTNMTRHAMERNPKYEQNMALCVLDVSTATFFLGQAGLLINAGVKVCGKIDESTRNGDLVLAEKEKAACSATITYVIAAFSYVASFLAASASQCANTLDLPSYCAQDVSGFLASLALLAHAGSSLRDTCGVHKQVLTADEAAFAAGTPINHDRRLQVAGSSPQNALLKGVAAGNAESISIRQADIAECVFDVGQATLFLARAGAAVNAAVKDCSTYQLRSTGRVGQAKCAVDINGVIGSFSFVASMISFAVSKCPILINTHALCAGEIINLIAGLAGVAATASGFKESCGLAGIPGQVPPSARRMSQNFSDAAAPTAAAAAPADAAPVTLI
mmetsp:Transcript_78556/g.168330  ORF Transcript_78556/g.168330 Transcript_78556/m.168330 type:complete len:354 (-) Transcript_78556:91-1152(-)